jgi:hypothetical protein
MEITGETIDLILGALAEQLRSDAISTWVITG